MLQIDFKWQVQAFKDVLLRGKSLDLWEKHKNEFDSNAQKVASGIASITARLQSPEYSAIAESVSRLAEEHKQVTAKYAAAMDLYMKAVSERSGNAAGAADEAVRGIDRSLNADVYAIADFVRQQSVANAAAAAKTVSQIRSEASVKIYVVAAMLVLLVVGAGLYAMRAVMAVLGAEPHVLRDVAEKISAGDLTTTISSHDADNEASLASQLLLMQMKMRSLVIGIRDETKGALDRARRGAGHEEIVDDIRALSKSIRKFKTGAAEEAA